MAIKLGTRVREALPPPPEMVVTALAVDLDLLAQDPASPVVLATLEWETAEEEEGLGPVRHSRVLPLSALEEMTD